MARVCAHYSGNIVSLVNINKIIISADWNNFISFQSFNQHPSACSNAKKAQKNALFKAFSHFFSTFY